MRKFLRFTAALSTFAISGIVNLIPSTAWAGGGSHCGPVYGHSYYRSNVTYASPFPRYRVEPATGPVYGHSYYRSNVTYASPYIRYTPSPGYRVEPTTRPVYGHSYYRSNVTYASPYIPHPPHPGYRVEPATVTSYGGSNYSNSVNLNQFNTFDNLMKLGNESAQNREYKQALTWFQFALHEKPNNPDAIKAINIMQSYVQQGM